MGNNKTLLLRLTEALNAGNLDAVDEIFAPDYVRHDPSSLLSEAGIAEYKQAFSRIRRAFSDARWSVEEILEDGDRLIGRFTFHGTQDGPFFNVQPSGKEVTYPIIGIYRVEEGRIAEDWHIFDALGLWQVLIPEIADLIKQAQD